jgi:hypothetical protein
MSDDVAATKSDEVAATESDEVAATEFRHTYTKMSDDVAATQSDEVAAKAIAAMACVYSKCLPSAAADTHTHTLHNNTSQKRQVAKP